MVAKYSTHIFISVFFFPLHTACICGGAVPVPSVLEAPDSPVVTAGWSCRLTSNSLLARATSLGQCWRKTQ